MMADIEERMRDMALQVECDFCIRKALKSCLQCRLSYCEQHIQHHFESPSKKHRMVKAAKLQENICTEHDEVKSMFCYTDKQFICINCSMTEHKGHEMVLPSTEMAKRQRELRTSRQEIQQRIQSQEVEEVVNLPQEVEAINRSANAAFVAFERLVAEIHLNEIRSSDVKDKIISKQGIEVSRAEELQVKLLRENADLMRRYVGLRQLSRIEDQTLFLLKYASLPCLPNSTALPANTLPVRYFDDVTASVLEAGEELQDIHSNEWNTILMRVSEVEVLLPQDPKTRDEFLQYADEFSPYDRGSNFQLDENTASRQLLLSEENRKAKNKKVHHPQYANNDDRFMKRSQALCKTGLTGRHYWEVEWTGLGVSVAVAYRDIARTGTKNIFGRNDKSWALVIRDQKTYTVCEFKHNSEKTYITSHLQKSSRVGVFLDYKAGILSFYSISARSFTLLHEVEEEFSQPLYAGLGVYYKGSTAEFCEVE